MTADGAMEIARRSRGTPRIANRLLRRVRDFAEVRHEGKIDLAIAKSALQMLEVDEYGLDEIDRKLLIAIIERFGGGPVGLNALASSIAEDRGTIEDLYEPYLIQMRLPAAHAARPHRHEAGLRAPRDCSGAPRRQQRVCFNAAPTSIAESRSAALPDTPAPLPPRPHASTMRMCESSP